MRVVVLQSDGLVHDEAHVETIRSAELDVRAW